MTRIVDPVPYYSSIEKFLEEQRIVKASSVSGLDVASTEWWPGYTANVLATLHRKGQARDYQEIASRHFPSMCRGPTTRIRD